jgi:hypothetical protein
MQVNRENVLTFYAHFKAGALTLSVAVVKVFSCEYKLT